MKSFYTASVNLGVAMIADSHALREFTAAVAIEAIETPYISAASHDTPRTAALDVHVLLCIASLAPTCHGEGPEKNVVHWLTFWTGSSGVTLTLLVPSRT